MGWGGEWGGARVGRCWGGMWGRCWSGGGLRMEIREMNSVMEDLDRSENRVKEGGGEKMV